MSWTHQSDAAIARLKNEAQAADKRRGDEIVSLRSRLVAAEAFEAYVREELYPWLVDLEAFVIFGTPPPEPPP